MLHEVNRTLAVTLVVALAMIIFVTAYLNGQRQADLFEVSCSNAVGHREARAPGGR